MQCNAIVTETNQKFSQLFHRAKDQHTNLFINLIKNKLFRRINSLSASFDLFSPSKVIRRWCCCTYLLIVALCFRWMWCFNWLCWAWITAVLTNSCVRRANIFFINLAWVKIKKKRKKTSSFIRSFRLLADLVASAHFRANCFDIEYQAILFSKNNSKFLSSSYSSSFPSLSPFSISKPNKVKLINFTSLACLLSYLPSGRLLVS